MKRFIPPALLALALLSCSLWQPYAIMQSPNPGGVTSWPTPTDTATPTPHNCTVTASEALNLRSGPGTHYPVIAWLKPGDLLTITQQSKGWAQIVTPTGAAGWVNLIYCKIGE